MTGHFTTPDWVVLVAYFAVTLVVGLRLGRSSASAAGFTAADRSLPGWACGLSLFATFLSSISFLALPGAAFAADWTPFVFSLSLPFATWAAVRWFLPFYRASGEVSAYAHLESRFGPWARIYASGFYLLTQLSRAAMVLYLMALPLSLVLGVPIATVLLVVGGVVTLYALVGGIAAVIWTDALQALVLIVGALACLVLLLVRIPDGIPGLLAIAAEHDKFSLGSTDLADWSSRTFWVVLLNGLFINLQNFGIDQSYVQRYVASPTEAEARRSVWMGGLLYLPVSAVLFLIGTALFAFHQAHPAELAEVRLAAATQLLIREGAEVASPAFAAAAEARAATLTPAQVGDGAFPHFIGKHLPPGLTGLVIAAVLAAGMSTVSTSLNSSATVLQVDFRRRFLRPAASDAADLRFLRLATLAVGLLGTALAFLLLGVGSALDVWWTLSSVCSGGILGLFLLGRLSTRAGNAAAIPATVLGVAALAWVSLSAAGLWPDALSALRSPLHPFLAIVVGTTAILVGGAALAARLPRTHPRQP